MKDKWKKSKTAIVAQERVWVENQKQISERLGLERDETVTYRSMQLHGQILKQSILLVWGGIE